MSSEKLEVGRVRKQRPDPRRNFRTRVGLETWIIDRIPSDKRRKDTCCTTKISGDYDIQQSRATSHLAVESAGAGESSDFGLSLKKHSPEKAMTVNHPAQNQYDACRLA